MNCLVGALTERRVIEMHSLMDPCCDPTRTLVRTLLLRFGVFAAIGAVAVLVTTGTTTSVGASNTHVSSAVGTLALRTDSAAVGATAAKAVRGPGLAGFRWNPCEPISYFIPTRGGYRGSVADMRRAVHLIGNATGMTFVEVGSEKSNPEIIFKWESPATEPDLAGAVAARTGTMTLAHDNVVEIASATIYLDRTTAIRRGFARAGLPDWGQVYLHELGHAVGLSHVPGRVEIMNPAVSPFNHVLAAGDRARFHEVGRDAGCIPNSIRNP